MRLGEERRFAGQVHRLTSHSLSNAQAQRLAERHRKLGLIAKVVPHGGKNSESYAVYRACSNKPKTGPKRLKRIHVNQHMLRSNRKTPNAIPQPPLTIQTSHGSIRASTIKIDGDSELVYKPHDKLSCGAEIWIETNEPVILDGCSRMI